MMLAARRVLCTNAGTLVFITPITGTKYLACVYRVAISLCHNTLHPIPPHPTLPILLLVYCSE